MKTSADNSRETRRQRTLKRARLLAAVANRHNEELTFFKTQREVATTERDSLSQAIETVKSGCDTTQKHIGQVHSTLDTASTALPHDRLSFLKMKEAVLKSELEQMRTGLTAEDVLVNAEVQMSEAQEETWRSIRDIESTIECLGGTVTETQKLVEREALILQERIDLRNALSNRLESMPAASDLQDHLPRLQQRLELQVGEVQEANGMLMHQLSEFLDRYYPEDSNHGGSPSHAGSLGLSQDQGRGLKELLQDLMNRSVTKADNPWLHLTAQNSNPKHVELLLRAGIAVKDPEDGRRLKLVDFYH